MKAKNYHDRGAKPPPKPLNSESLRALALHYAGRYATTQAKLRQYLMRKHYERGWSADDPQPSAATIIEALAAEFAELGYVNDGAVAETKARSAIRRGYGLRRLSQDLDAAGISPSDSHSAREDAAASAHISAENFARRKRIGPYATAPASPDQMRKQIAAFLRAGHSFDLAKRFVNAAPGEDVAGD